RWGHCGESSERICAVEEGTLAGAIDQPSAVPRGKSRARQSVHARIADPCARTRRILTRPGDGGGARAATDRRHWRDRRSRGPARIVCRRLFPRCASHAVRLASSGVRDGGKGRRGVSRTRRATIAATFGYAQFGLALIIGIGLVPLILSRLGMRTWGLWLATGELLSYAGMVDLG